MPQAVVTVVERVHYQPQDRMPEEFPSTYELLVEDAEDAGAFLRAFDVGLEWRPLPAPPFARCSLLCVANESKATRTFVTGEDGTVRPDGPRANVMVEMRQAGSVWLIPPGQSFRGRPATLNGIELRCLSNDGRVRVLITPE